MACNCNTNTSSSGKSCGCKGKKYSSGITYDGEKLICNKDGLNKFTIKPCTNLNDLLGTFAEQICSLWNEAISEDYISNVEFVDDEVEFGLRFTGVGNAFDGFIDFSSLIVSPGAIITADNGLTVDPANNVQLGGTLLKDTTITNGAYSLLFTKNTALIPGIADAAINVSLTGSERLYGVEVQNQSTNTQSAAFYSVSTNGYAGQFRGFSAFAASVIISNERTDPGGG